MGSKQGKPKKGRGRGKKGHGRGKKKLRSEFLKVVKSEPREFAISSKAIYGVGKRNTMPGRS